MTIIFSGVTALIAIVIIFIFCRINVVGVCYICHSSLQVKMNRMRQRIAARLKEAQNTCAMLTTFNEIDMRYVPEGDILGME